MADLVAFLHTPGEEPPSLSETPPPMTGIDVEDKELAARLAELKNYEPQKYAFLEAVVTEIHRNASPTYELLLNSASTCKTVGCYSYGLHPARPTFWGDKHASADISEQHPVLWAYVLQILTAQHYTISEKEELCERPWVSWVPCLTHQQRKITYWAKKPDSEME